MQWLEHVKFWAVQQYYLEEKNFAAFKNFLWFVRMQKILMS